MKQVRAEKYNIAWFRLAECISRREKERALGVYRLLSHSFENGAVVHQLEGDIMLAFNDEVAACERYAKAAELYEERGEFMQALAVYDHMLMLQDNPEIIKKIVDLYAQLSDQQRMFKYLKRFCKHLLKQHDAVQLMTVLQKANLPFNQKAALCIELTFAALQDASIDRQITLQLIAQTVERLMHDQHVLGQFLSKLQVMDEKAYAYACSCMQHEVEE